MSLTVQMLGRTSDPGITAKVWQKIEHEKFRLDRNSGFYLRDDFLSWDGTVATNVGRYIADSGGYRSREDTSTTLTQLATEVGGVLQAALNAADNQEITLQGGATGAPWKISSGTSAKKFTWETRVRLGSVADLGVFVGLAEETQAVADFLVNDTGEIVSKDMVGFQILTAAPTTLVPIYRKAGQNKQSLSTTKTVAANTWYKLALVYDGKTLEWFVDGVSLGSIGQTELAAATFPDGEELAPIWSIKTGEGVAKTLDIDWVQIAQQA